MAGRLIAHSGGVVRTRTELALLPTPAGTDTWKPVPHWELIGHLVDGLTDHGITISREQYATSGRDAARLFGVLDLVVPDLDTPDFGMSLGIRGANDQSLAIQATAGAHVFVCDNMAFSGDSGTIVLKKKHTSRLDLRRVVPPAIDLYLEKAGAFVIDIDRMRNHVLTDEQAKAIIFDAFVKSPVMSRRLFPVVAGLYFDDDEQRSKFDDRSLWSLNNAFTEAVKILRVVPQQRAAIAVGRTFGRILHRAKTAQIAVNAGFNPDEIEVKGAGWDVV